MASKRSESSAHARPMPDNRIDFSEIPESTEAELKRARRVGTSAIELGKVPARNVIVSDDALMVDLADGRTITVPLAWFPRLAHGTPAERAKWRLMGGGEGIHWPDLDEDVSVESLLAGRKSGETQESLRRWLGARKVG
jgi:Protein of unknown function (DUF2442)